MDMLKVKSVIFDFKAAATYRTADVASVKLIGRNKLLSSAHIVECHLIYWYTLTSQPCQYHHTNNNISVRP